MARSVSIISSMATRRILAELVPHYASRTGCEVTVTSVGGVDAARRIQAGEPFDLAILARDAVEKLARDGFLIASSISDFATSPAAIAVPEHTVCPELCDHQAIRDLLASARNVGLSSGPSGRAVRSMLQQWSIGEPQITLVEAPPGMPVARLVAAGTVDLGFQQMSELLGEPGIRILGPVPDDILATTVFSMALCRNAPYPPKAASMLLYLSSADAASAKLRGGMQVV